ncbi:MAG: tyrosine-type recombinase/integrase [Spirochaeta sp.]|jgi:integrase|nr:tyrosine-type recombinase/integrase [Spirochaeta sp.]
MRRFSLYRRGKYFYCRFWNQTTHCYTNAISTQKENRNEAIAQVVEWEAKRLPGKDQTVDDYVETHGLLKNLRTIAFTNKDIESIVSVLVERGYIAGVTYQSEYGSKPLIPYLRMFWTYDESPYVREKLAYGHRIGQRRCYEQTSRINHWERYFGDVTIAEVSNEKIREFQLYLKEKKLAAKTINMISETGTIALRWLFDHGHLPADPTAGLRKFSGTPRKRDVFTDEEVKLLFAGPWKDERARVGNLLAATTGMRAGEVTALRTEDIGKDVVFVRHSWNFADGLKAPKNDETRTLPLLPSVRDSLLTLAKRSPHGENGFIFYGTEPEQPMNLDVLGRELNRRFIDISLNDEDRSNPEKREETRKRMKARGLSFHSWRHLFAAKVADQVDIRSVQLATGHKSQAMAEHYAKHRNDEHARKVFSVVRDIYADIA